jgi:threonyl-tRNA synthetase
MFVVENDDKVMALKPMNCPCHIEIFKTKLTSYRDLPIRMSEFGSCMRNESSGSLHGLMRVRGMTQDDAHIFCTEEQIKSETIAFCSLLQEVYREIGFNEIKVKFSDRPKVRAGTDETWDKAESALREATLASGLTFELNQGDGAFYGPKLEFHLRDAIGREWQCGTFQVDFVLPERLGAHYIDTNGDKQTPVILHRAIFGSLERFIGMLIEHYAGNFPLWLAPTQVVVLTIVDDANEYAARVHEQLVSSGFRSLLDKGKEKINYKVRKYSLLKIPYTIVIGRKEVEDGSIMVREFGSDVQKSYSQLREFEQWLETKIRSKQ